MTCPGSPMAETALVFGSLPSQICVLSTSLGGLLTEGESRGFFRTQVVGLGAQGALEPLPGTSWRRGRRGHGGHTKVPVQTEILPNSGIKED